MGLTREFVSSIILTAEDRKQKDREMPFGSAKSPMSGGRKVNRMKRMRKRTVRK